MNPIAEALEQADMYRRQRNRWRLAFVILVLIFIVDLYGTMNKAIENRDIIKKQSQELNQTSSKIAEFNKTKNRILEVINQEKKGSATLNEWIAEELLKASL